jgi:hypothetical protein
MKRGRVSLVGLCLFTVALAITGSLYHIIGRWHDKQRFPTMATSSRLRESV